MAINRFNPGASFNKRLAKRISIFLIVISIPISIVLALYFTLGGKEKGKQLKLSEKIYQNIFQDKTPFKYKDITIGKATATVEEIYSNYLKVDEDNKLPVYTDSVRTVFLSNETQNIFQFVDSDFKAGTGIFKNWGNIVIIIFNKNNKVESVQYKHAIN